MGILYQGFYPFQAENIAIISRTASTNAGDQP